MRYWLLLHLNWELRVSSYADHVADARLDSTRIREILTKIPKERGILEIRNYDECNVLFLRNIHSCSYLSSPVLFHVRLVFECELELSSIPSLWEEFNYIQWSFLIVDIFSCCLCNLKGTQRIRIKNRCIGIFFYYNFTVFYMWEDVEYTCMSLIKKKLKIFVLFELMYKSTMASVVITDSPYTFYRAHKYSALFFIGNTRFRLRNDKGNLFHLHIRSVSLIVRHSIYWLYRLNSFEERTAYSQKREIRRTLWRSLVNATFIICSLFHTSFPHYIALLISHFRIFPSC